MEVREQEVSGERRSLRESSVLRSQIRDDHDVAVASAHSLNLSWRLHP